MVFPSPTKPSKRKRDDAGSQYGSPPIPSSPRQPVVNLQGSHVIDKEELGSNSNSPRSVVAGHLGHLEIYEDTAKPEYKHRVIATDGDPSLFSQIDRAQIDKDKSPMTTTPTAGAEPFANNTLADTDGEETEHHPPVQKKGRVSTSPASSPKAKGGSTLHLDSERRSKSPPLSSNSEHNPLTWSDSEITGHLGTDPDDDGYGINGLGFKPTPAMAYSRSERRKRQIAAWRSREASEARQSRRARRGIGDESNEDKEMMNPSHKKVKFET